MKRWLFAWVTLMSAFAQAGQLVGLTPDEVRAMLDRGAVLVDVRTPQEWKSTGLITGSKGLTYFDAYGAYDNEGWLRQLKPLLKSPDQPLILVCRSGHRSATVGKMLVNEVGYGKVYHLEKGIRGWIAENQPLAQQQ